MVFCNNGMDDVVIADALVTILILIDGFLQYMVKMNLLVFEQQSQSLF